MTLTVLNSAKNAATLQAVTITGDYTQTNTCGAILAAACHLHHRRHLHANRRSAPAPATSP